MTSLLPRDNYPFVQSLFDGMTSHLAVVTVLAGILPGRVYVDDPASPHTAILIPANQHRVYASGEPVSRLLADVLHLLFTEAHEDSFGCVIYFDAARSWKQAIEHVLREQESVSSWRQFYRLRAPSPPTPESLPARITIDLIDEAMMDASSLAHRQELRDEILSEIPSLEHFFRHNFGFCAHDSQQFVAWCLAEYHYQGRYELGIETIEAYRRQGVATHLAKAVIARAFAQGATEIGWHCWAKNTPSVATALRLGFEKALDYPVYYCEYRQPPA